MANESLTVQQQVQQKLQESSARTKAAVDKHRRIQMFNEGDQVMVYLRKERLPAGHYSKLQPKKHGPFSILRKINDNAYMVDLPASWGISKTFNTADLFPYYSAVEPSLQSGSSHAEENDAGQDVELDAELLAAKYLDQLEWKTRMAGG